MSDFFDFDGIVVYALLAIFVWLSVVAVVMGFLWLSDNKKEECGRPDIKTRIWRRLQSAHSELFPLFTIEEKKEMAQLLKTTIANAELFKRMPLAEIEKMARKRMIRETVKKVEFKL